MRHAPTLPERDERNQGRDGDTHVNRADERFARQFQECRAVVPRSPQRTEQRLLRFVVDELIESGARLSALINQAVQDDAARHSDDQDENPDDADPSPDSDRDPTR